MEVNGGFHSSSFSTCLFVFLAYYALAIKRKHYVLQSFPQTFHNKTAPLA